MYSVSKSRNKKDVSKVLCDVFNFINPDNQTDSLFFYCAWMCGFFFRLTASPVFCYSKNILIQ